MHSLYITEFLIRVESYFADICINIETYHLFTIPLVNLQIDAFQNDS